MNRLDQALVILARAGELDLRSMNSVLFAVRVRVDPVEQARFHLTLRQGERTIHLEEPREPNYGTRSPG